MAHKIVKFSFRTEEELMKKLSFIAAYDGRSANKELEVIARKYIAEFEKEHGKITDPQQGIR